jgi:large subunit ribosomal protein L18
MDRQKRLNVQRTRRTRRVRKALRGTAERPRLSVARSHKHIYVQVIDDETGRTICASSSRTVCGAYGGTVAHAKQVGVDIAEKALARNVKRVAFDRGPYRYHGRLRALADAAREKGLEF